MFYWITTAFADPLKEWGLYGLFNVFRYISFRASMAAATAFLLSWYFGPAVIAWLKRVGLCEKIRSDSAALDARHAFKAGTATMGGLLILGAMLAALALWGHWGNYYVILAVVTTLWLGAVGAADDYIKITTLRKGLNKRQKLLFQLGLGLILGVLLYDYHRLTEFGTKLTIPFFKGALVDLGVFYIVLVGAVVTFASNAVNLTDGMDGLAGGCSIMAGLAFAVLAYLAGHAALASYLWIPYMPGAGELAVVCAAMVGGLTGFLWYNCAPAAVFMGDTGALALGGLMGYVAVVIRQEVLLLIVGGVFLAEFLSVVAQVLSFRLRHGKRVLKMAPLHHHFQFSNWSDTQVVTRFWIVGGLLALFAVASLKLR